MKFKNKLFVKIKNLLYIHHFWIIEAILSYHIYHIISIISYLSNYYILFLQMALIVLMTYYYRIIISRITSWKSKCYLLTTSYKNDLPNQWLPTNIKIDHSWSINEQSQTQFASKLICIWFLRLQFCFAAFIATKGR